tara:strand:+ start:879 stop:1556 length:678 start_codon:yes stop_codon:yes gene_type:complete
MSKCITTTAPINIEYLKEYFTDKETSYLIDYAGSTLKGEKLLVYLGNLDLPADIKFDTKEDLEEMIVAYASSTFIVSIQSLENAMLNLLFKNDIGITVTNELQELIDHWSIRLKSCLLFNLHTLDLESTKSYIQKAPKDDTDTLVGVNFISLLKYEPTCEFIINAELDDCIYYEKYFNEYMFKGKNLYEFWANKNNPLFLSTWAVATGVRDEILTEDNELAKQEN